LYYGELREGLSQAVNSLAEIECTILVNKWVGLVGVHGCALLVGVNVFTIVVTEEVFFLQPACLIRRLDHPEACILEEMSPESISRGGEGKIAGRDPGSSFDDVVLIIEGWQGKIIIDRVSFEASERIEGCAGPLPNITLRIKNAIDLIFIDRSWGSIN
jgi:hypothetical protein